MDPNDRDLEDDDEIALPEEDEGEDAGSLDHEGGDEAEAGQEPEDAEGQEGLDEPRVGRRERRVQALRREAQEANERAAKFERELNEERQRARQPQQPQTETPEQEANRLALMTVDERVEYRLAKAQRQNELQMNLLRFQHADATDKAAYEAKSAYDPRYKKYQPEVERLLAEERGRGNYGLPRETILFYVLGKKVAENRTREKQRERGRENIRRQQARADSGRGDIPATRQRQGSGNTLADLERRLDGVNI